MAQSQRTLNMLLPCRINPNCQQTHSWKEKTITTLYRSHPWDGKSLFLKDLTKDPHGDFMGWGASVRAPQRKTTYAKRDGCQQQEQSGYQTQWYSFHREDTRMTSQRPQHKKRWSRRPQKCSATVSECWQQTTQHTHICPISLD